MKMEIQGLEELQRDIEKLLKTKNEMRKVVKKNGAELQKNAMSYARDTASGGVFSKGYSTGHTRRNLQQNGVRLTDDGLTATISSTTDYAAYLEYGTRYMEAEPYMKPAYEKQKRVFEEEIENAVEKNL